MLIFIWLMRYSYRIPVVRVTAMPVLADRSPLIQMLDKITPEEFEKQVRQHPEWVNQKSSLLDDRPNRSVLTDATIAALTNQVRLLIINGADVPDALRWCKRYDYPDGTRLVLDVCKELKKEVKVP